uniref:ATP synthase F0 subunit 8 n=1 Tax=Prasinoderma coloniale TaxID=156133 RepID=V9PB84_9VIRI|nr:ATP synthase F0 subunit 8 [Prasinoderma coloniale]AGW52203.1 ATP synthase F0 subunit 8 [Prasinoderma coloniale]
MRRENLLFYEKVPERSIGADCKSADESLRRFESYSSHVFFNPGKSFYVGPVEEALKRVPILLLFCFPLFFYMPQLDLVSYAAQFMWLTLVFGTYYVFSVHSILPTTGTLLKTRAAQEVDASSLGVETAASDLTSMNVFTQSLEAHTTHAQKSVHALSTAFDTFQLQIVDIDAVWKKAFQKEIFEQAAEAPLQASIAVSGAYGSDAGVQTFPAAGYLQTAAQSLGGFKAGVKKPKGKKK